MATFSWPADLYGKVLKGSFRELPPDNTFQSNMDTGPPKIRRRSTSNTRPIEVSHFFTAADMVTFDSFYDTTLNSGSLPFNYRHPRTQVLGEYVFTELPEYVDMNQGFRVTTKMEKLV